MKRTLYRLYANLVLNNLPAFARNELMAMEMYSAREYWHRKFVKFQMFGMQVECAVLDWFTSSK